MMVLMILFVCLVVLLIAIIQHKNNSIKSLEKVLNNIRKIQVSNVMNILYEIKEAQDKAEITTTHDAEIKRILNHYLEIYSRQERYFSKRDFENQFNEACEKIKKELNEYIDQDNV